MLYGISVLGEKEEEEEGGGGLEWGIPQAWRSLPFR